MKADKINNTAAARGKVATTTQKDSVLEQPVPRKLLTSQVANDSALTTPPPKHYAPRDPSVASPGVPMVSVGTAIKSKQTNPSEAVAPDEYGLSDKQHIMNEKDLANVLLIVIVDAFDTGKKEGSCSISNSRIISQCWELTMRDPSPCLMKRSPGSTIPPTLDSAA